MSLPVLLVIDGDLAALEDVRAQLVHRYGHDYRVLAASDPEEALGGLAELADTGAELALVLAARTLAGVTGGGLLERARQLHPHAKVPHTVHIIGEQWSGRAHELRETFQSCATPHTFCLADSAEGRRLLAKTPPDVRLPVMILADGRALSDPSNAEIAEAAGAPTDFDGRDFDVVIVGAGPAGLSAAVYAASEGLRTLVVDEGGIGGQARSCTAQPRSAAQAGSSS